MDGCIEIDIETFDVFGDMQIHAGTVETVGDAETVFMKDMRILIRQKVIIFVDVGRILVRFSIRDDGGFLKVQDFFILHGQLFKDVFIGSRDIRDPFFTDHGFMISVLFFDQIPLFRQVFCGLDFGLQLFFI